jgi:hypothetical protein
VCSFHFPFDEILITDNPCLAQEFDVARCDGIGLEATGGSPARSR